MPQFVDSELGFQNDLSALRRLHHRLDRTVSKCRAPEYLDMAAASCAFVLSLMDVSLTSDDPTTAIQVRKKIAHLHGRLEKLMLEIESNGDLPPSYTAANAAPRK